MNGDLDTVGTGDKRFHRLGILGAEIEDLADFDSPGVPALLRRHLTLEARGVTVYRADERKLQVDTHIWAGDTWELTAVRSFSRGGQPPLSD